MNTWLTSQLETAVAAAQSANGANFEYRTFETYISQRIVAAGSRYDGLFMMNLLQSSWRVCQWKKF